MWQAVVLVSAGAFAIVLIALLLVDESIRESPIKAMRSGSGSLRHVVLDSFFMPIMVLFGPAVIVACALMPANIGRMAIPPGSAEGIACLGYVNCVMSIITLLTSIIRGTVGFRKNPAPEG